MENSEIPSSSQASLCVPHDLLHRILSLLPLKTLFRLRCVCRLWRSLPFSLLFLDFASSPSSSLPDASHDRWFFAFRLLARKVNEHRVRTYKATTYTYSIDHDREMVGSSAYDLCSSKSYEFLAAASPLATYFNTGVLDIVASANGLLLITLRMKESQGEDSLIKLFVYNPLSRDLRALPPPRWASQKLAMACETDGNGESSYKVYSLGRHYRPGTTNLLFSFEIYDSAQCKHWQLLSHVSANLSGDGELHGNAAKVMGYVNSKAISDARGFIYWMRSLEYRDEAGRHTQISSCDMNKGFFYTLPGLPYKTTFAGIWPHESGLQLVCGVAKEEAGPHVRTMELEARPHVVTRAVEVWELHQGQEDPKEEERYGSRPLPQGTKWQQIERMPHHLWEQLTRGKAGNGHRIACAVGSPLVFVVAEDEEEQMVVYNAVHRTWQLSTCYAILHKLFHDQDPHYYKVLPWIVSFTPNPSTRS